MFKSLNKALEDANIKLINIIIFLFGVLITFIGLPMDSNDQSIVFYFVKMSDLKTTMISVGCSIIASSIIAFISSRYLIKQNKVRDVIEKWGLEAIYKTRSEMNISCNSNMEILKYEMDLIAFGLRGFRDAQGSLIEEKVKQGLSVRILTINPNSIFLVQREKDEREVIGKIRNDIFELGTWVEKLKLTSQQPEKIQIKYYNSLPLDSYFREDDYIYIGPYQYGKVSQQTISYEYRNNSLGYKYYKDYFEQLWNNEEFAKFNYKEFIEDIIGT